MIAGSILLTLSLILFVFNRRQMFAALTSAEMEEAPQPPPEKRARPPRPPKAARVVPHVIASEAKQSIPQERLLRCARNDGKPDAPLRPPSPLALVGLILFGQGAYIHAKALLAQVLLERAFNETIATGHQQNRGHGRTPGRSRASR